MVVMARFVVVACWRLVFPATVSVELALRDPPRFKTDEMVVEPVTARAEVVAPVTTRKPPLVAFKSDAIVVDAAFQCGLTATANATSAINVRLIAVGAAVVARGDGVRVAVRTTVCALATAACGICAIAATAIANAGTSASRSEPPEPDRDMAFPPPRKRWVMT